MRRAAALAGAMLCAAQAAAPIRYSQLWGADGSKWDRSVLKDFSRVGYRAGDAAIPAHPVRINVRDLGAKGDGTTDDTEAFRKAIRDCPAGGAVWVPDGTYLIGDWIRFDGKSDFTLRGQSRGKTILWFPKGLEEIHPKSAQTGHGTTTTAWSWSGGYLWFDNPREVGIEDFTFKWPDKKYPGHFLERGYNGIQYAGAQDCWVRNILFYNSDLALNLDGGSVRNSILDIRFDAFAGRRNGNEGSHHGIQVSGAGTKDNLIMGMEFTLDGASVHELTVDWGTSGNVFAACKGTNMHLDHHKPAGKDGPFGNLWTDIDLGEGTAVWKNNASGSGMDDVYWNIRARRNIAAPAANLKNIAVGFPTSAAVSLNPARPWLEPLDPAELSPANLYLAQQALRGSVGVARRAMTAPGPKAAGDWTGRWMGFAKAGGGPVGADGRAR